MEGATAPPSHPPIEDATADTPIRTVFFKCHGSLSLHLNAVRPPRDPVCPDRRAI